MPGITMHRRTTRLLILSAAIVPVSVLFPRQTNAADDTWIGGSGDWLVGTNWSLGRAPLAGDNVIVTHPSASITVNYIPSGVAPEAYVSPMLGAVRVEATNPFAFTTLRFQNAYRFDASDLTIGDTRSGAVFHGSGVVNSTDLHLARAATGTGSYSLFGSGVVSGNQLHVGFGGTGTFSQSGGQATFTTNAVVAEQPGAKGTLEISGGTFTTPSLRVGDAPGATGILNVSGGTLSAGVTPFGARIGHGGSAQVRHTGGTITTPDSFLTFADRAGSSATYELSGTGVLSTRNTAVASGGSATVHQRGGTHTATNQLSLAVLPGSSSQYNLSGGLLSAPTIILNPNSILHQSGGTLKVTNFNHAGGTYRWSGGTLERSANLQLLTYEDLGGQSTLNPDHSLIVRGVTTLQTPLTLDGGAFSTQTLNASGAGALRFRRGDLAVLASTSSVTIGGGQPLGPTLAIPSHSSATFGGSATVDAGSIVSIDGGSMNANVVQNAGLVHLTAPSSRLVATTFTNQAGSRLISGGHVSAATLNNDGEIVLAEDSAALRSEKLSNGGLLRGRGSVYADTFANTRSGEVRAESGNTLRFLPAGKNNPVTNEGRLALLGGTLDLTTLPLVNGERGVISGRGTVAADNLGNAGRISLSAGLSDLFTPFTNTGNGSVVITGNGTATFHEPVTLERGTSFQVSAGSSAVFLAAVSAEDAESISGAGAKFFEGGETFLAAPLATTGSTRVAAPATLSATAIREASLTIEGVVTVPADGTADSTSRLGLLTILADGSLDLTDNDLVVAADLSTRDAVLAEVNSYIASARNGASGRWTGPGLTSAAARANPLTTLAAVSNSGFANFSGQSVGPHDILIKYTYNGDANLDGTITSDDYFRIDSGFLAQPAAPTYNQGDFNYDGAITSDDYFLIDSAFLGQTAALADAAGLTLVAASVPEPAATSVVVAMGVGILSGRRERKH